MSKTIYKYEISPDTTHVTMPKGAEILSLQAQNNIPCVCALVNPKSPLEERKIDVFGTGHEVFYNRSIQGRFIGTFQMYDGKLVFHVFERIS